MTKVVHAHHRHHNNRISDMSPLIIVTTDINLFRLVPPMRSQPRTAKKLRRTASGDNGYENGTGNLHQHNHHNVIVIVTNIGNHRDENKK